MTNKNNFRWLSDDIDNTLVLKLIYKNRNGSDEYHVFSVLDVLETTGDKLDIKTANIDDLTNLLSLGMVRFVNVRNSNDILDIPLKKLYLLYKNASILGENVLGKEMDFKELDAFSIIDGVPSDNFLVMSSLINTVSDDLDRVMKIAYEFDNYSMQEKFDSMSEVTVINHRRLIADEMNNG